MSKVNQPYTPATSKASSSFIKRGVAIVGSSGLVFGLGFTGATSASANGVDCSGRTVTASDNPAANVSAINTMLNTVGVVCLSGDFTIDDTIFVERDQHFYGIGNTTVQHSIADNFVFVSDVSGSEAIYDITIEKLTIKNSGRGVQAEDVFVVDSTFSQNTDGAIFAYGSVTVSNSTFINNSGFHGGAIYANTNAEIDNSTFDGNTSGNNGGAIYLAINEETESNELFITNSTFLDNSANSGGGAIFSPYTVITNSTFVENSAFEGGAVSSEILVTHNSTFVGNSAQTEGAEGGALYSSGGYIFFNTFLNNEAPDLSGGPGDTPGNAIYRYFSSESSSESPIGIFLVGNIFAGSSNRAQIGIGDIAAPVSDAGGNVFSTSSETEEDISPQDPSSVYGASLVSIFGTNSPELLSHEPNLNGTQTVAPSPGSVALDIVPSGIFQEVIELLYEGGLNSEVDQRGAPRTNPADAGAFEGSVTPSLATTGSTTPWWAVWSSAAMLAIGGLAMAYAKRSRRRIR